MSSEYRFLGQRPSHKRSHSHHSHHSSKFKEHCSEKSKSQPCGEWSFLENMLDPRENFALVSGPDQTATGTVTGLDGDPRVYAIGGAGQKCEKYDPNQNQWFPIHDLPEDLKDCSGTFAPDYGAENAKTLGYIYVIGDNKPKIFQYDILNDSWTTFIISFSVKNASIQYLDDIGGPLAQLFVSLTGVNLPPCTDSQTIWIVGGEGTETQTWFVNSNVQGELDGEFARGPDLPLARANPLVGRVFWRDAGITSFGVSNCASIIVAGGSSLENPEDLSKDVQLLIRDSECNWKWITRRNNPSQIPDELLTLAAPIAKGSFGTEQWPETLVTGGRAILFGGISEKDKNSEPNSGLVEYGQFRFFEGRYRRDPDLPPGPSQDSLWNINTSMPGLRINFGAAPLSQENSSRFGGRRVSRFICAGGSIHGETTKRVQLFELPVPGPFVEIVSRV